VLHGTIQPSASPNPHRRHDHLLARAPILRCSRHPSSPSWPSPHVRTHHVSCRPLCLATRPSTAAPPHSVLAYRGHGVHRVTSTLASPGEGRRRLGHHLPRLTEDTMIGRSAYCKCIFQVFQRYVVYGFCKGRSGCCTCCNSYTPMLQAFVQNISSISQMHVASVLSRCCICFHTDVAKRLIEMFLIHFRHMLQVFYLDVTYVSHKCCTHLFKCFICFRFMLQQVFFMLQVFSCFKC
jgi:hypothetical protein